MTVQVLTSRSEIKLAREELRRRRVSCMTPGWLRFLHDRSLIKGINLGDEVKSWDLLNSVDFLARNVAKDSRILDIGAYASEILCVLYRMGYSELDGIDLNPGIKRMPHARVIRYAAADFTQTSFAARSFAAITAISVIEHGLNSNALLAEIARLLQPGGYFVASFDYWPEKLDTAGVDMFGLDWTIFSAEEVGSFIVEAKKHDLHACGPVHLDAIEPVIHCAGRSYTFAWLALKMGAS